MLVSLITPLAQLGPTPLPLPPMPCLCETEFSDCLSLPPPDLTVPTQLQHLGAAHTSYLMMMYPSLRLVILLQPQKGSRYKCPPEAPYLTEVLSFPFTTFLGFCLEKVFQCRILSIRHSLASLSPIFSLFSPSFLVSPPVEFENGFILNISLPALLCII